jgi:hypothetical protein
MCRGRSGAVAGGADGGADARESAAGDEDVARAFDLAHVAFGRRERGGGWGHAVEIGTGRLGAGRVGEDEEGVAEEVAAVHGFILCDVGGR